jgi:hypothetical protein
MSEEFVPPIQGEVIAVGTSVNVALLPKLGEMIEQAMVEAIHACHAQGITDAATILEAKMAAMEKAKQDFAALGGS